MTVVVSTRRLRLRPLAVTDRDDFVRLHADERVSSQVGGFDADTAAARLERFEQQWRQLGYGMFAIELPSGEFAGRCGFVHWPELGAAGETEIGWVLRPDLWGSGLVTEAARACLGWVFDPRAGGPGLDRITAMIVPGNHRSEAVAERIGMTFERQDLFRDKLVNVFAVTAGTTSAERAARPSG